MAKKKFKIRVNAQFDLEVSEEYLQKLKEENPDKLKEYRRTAYLNRKAKLQNITENEKVSNNENI